MQKIIITISLLVLTLVYSPRSKALDITDLSPELRGLLQKEMQALQKGMNEIFQAYLSGQTIEISDIAEKMKNSYILMQNLTEEQKHQLHQLPQSFLEADQQFHEYAEMLEHVAYNKNRDMIGFYYYKLTESCMNCHAKHAQHRFGEFKNNKKQSHGH